MAEAIDKLGSTAMLVSSRSLIVRVGLPVAFDLESPLSDQRVFQHVPAEAALSITWQATEQDWRSPPVITVALDVLGAPKPGQLVGRYPRPGSVRRNSPERLCGTGPQLRRRREYPGD